MRWFRRLFPRSSARTAQVATEFGFESLREDRIVALRGEIHEDSSSVTIASLLFLAAADPSRPLHLHVDSPGGGVTDSLAIHDTMEHIAPPVHTHCVGRAAGTALLLLAKGTKGQRTAAAGCRISLTDVTAAPHVDGAERERWLSLLATLLADASGQSEELIRADMVVNRTLSAQEAITYGLLDRIVE